MTSFGFGGFGLESSDPNIEAKIARVKAGRKSSKDQVSDYLQRELGVDARELPFHPKAASERVRKLMTDADTDEAVLVGNSMGLKSVKLGDVTITDSDQHGLDWHDWVRVYDSYVRDAERDGHPAYSFSVDEDLIVAPLTGPVNPNPMFYPTGTVLRIERQTLLEDGTVDVERRYVHVGGPWRDTDLTVLESMDVIADPTGWRTVEVL